MSKKCFSPLASVNPKLHRGFCGRALQCYTQMLLCKPSVISWKVCQSNLDVETRNDFGAKN